MNLRREYSRAAIALLTLTASHLVIAIPYSEIEQYEEHIQSVEKARETAPEVVDILVLSVEKLKRNGKVFYVAEAEVFNVIRTHRGIKVGDVISIEYTDISASARRHNQNVEHNKIPGPGFKPELYILEAEDETRAYLKPSSDNPRLLALAAGTASFAGMSTEQATNPCADHPKGPFTSQISKCAALELESAKYRLKEMIKDINEYLDGSIETHDGGDTIGKQRRALATSSAAWESYRNNTCQLVYLQYYGGSFARLYELNCMTLLTEERIQQLDKVYSGWVDE